MLLNCPWCGERDATEFTYGGESHIARPGPPEAVTDERWADYMFYRDNPVGPTRERWLHRYGCGQWINLVRDTRTHAILASYRMTDPRPEAV